MITLGIVYGGSWQYWIHDVHSCISAKDILPRTWHHIGGDAMDREEVQIHGEIRNQIHKDAPEYRHVQFHWNHEIIMETGMEHTWSGGEKGEEERPPTCYRHRRKIIQEWAQIHHTCLWHDQQWCGIHFIPQEEEIAGWILQYPVPWTAFLHYSGLNGHVESVHVIHHGTCSWCRKEDRLWQGPCHEAREKGGWFHPQEREPHVSGEALIAMKNRMSSSVNRMILNLNFYIC